MEAEAGAGHLHFWSARGARLLRAKGKSLILGLFGESCGKLGPGDKHICINHLRLNQLPMRKPVDKRT